MSAQLQVTGEAKIRDIQGPVVANDGVITALDGAASQYVRGDGTLADFPTSSGGGSSVSYYLNSSVSQGTIGGVAYRELSKDPIIGGGTDITISANGYVANYITDVNDPDVTIVPGGNFNCEFYFSVSNDTGNPFTYAELYKYDGTTFTLLGSSVGVPEYINQGTIIAPYYFAIPVPTSTLALTDRLAIRIYVNVDGRTVTLHTENSHLCQVVTTLSKGMVSLNNLTDQSQFLTTGTSGTNFAIASTGDTHTFNLPIASATNTGKLSSTDWSTFNGKVPYTGATANVDLGDYSIKVNGILAYGASGSGGLIAFRQTGTLAGVATGSAYIGSVTAGQLSFYYGNNLFASILSNTSLTADRTYTLPDLSGTLALLEGFQTFTGVKTFDEGLSLKSGAYPTPATGYSSIGGNSFGITVITKQSSTIYTSDLGFPATNRTFTFPNLDGTIALLEGTQTFSGRKYFSIAPIAEQGIILNAGITSFAAGQTTLNGNANGLTIGLGVTVGGTTTSYAHQLLFPQITPYSYTYPALSGTIALLEGTQTFTGYKTFANGLISASVQVNSGILLSNSVTSIPSSGYISLNGTASGLDFRTSTNVNSLIFQSGNYSYTFPATSGTLALTSNLSSYVPYTGATSDINTGNFSITSNYLDLKNALRLNGDTYNGAIVMTSNKGGQIYSTTNAINITPAGIYLLDFTFGGATGGSANLKNFRLDVTPLTLNALRTYTMPDASGTIALTSNLSAYLPLTGGTLTGALSGTSATFSTSITIAAGNFIFGGTSRLLYSNGSTGNNIYSGGSDGLRVMNQADSAILVTIANTGAATFSSSVTAGGNFVVDNASRFKNFETNASGTRTSYYSWDNTNNDLTIATIGSNPIRLSPNQATALYISGAGNVGIGTSSPSALLQVSGSGDQYIKITSTSFSNAGVKFNSVGGNEYSIFSDSALRFYDFTAGAERMRIRSGGSVGIGTTGQDSVKLEVRGGGTGSTNYTVLFTDSSANDLFFVRTDGLINTGTRTNSPYNLSNTGRTLVADSTGTIGYLVSTRESKANIKSIKNVDFIKQLNPVSFNYRKKDNINNVFTDEIYDTVTYGFIADEVEVVNKNLVFYKEDGSLAGVEYNNMIAILTKAVQELKAEIEEVKALINK